MTRDSVVDDFDTQFIREVFGIDDINIVMDIIIQHLGEYERVDL